MVTPAFFARATDGAIERDAVTSASYFWMYYNQTLDGATELQSHLAASPQHLNDFSDKFQAARFFQNIF